MNIDKIKEIVDKHRKEILIALVIIFIVLLILPISTRHYVKIDEEYDTVNDVALYIYKYNSLPKNFVTNNYADYMGWSQAETILYGYNYGGDNFAYKGSIKSYTKQENLKEADIYSNTSQLIRNNNRGTERLVFTHGTKKIQVFYTSNHYATFKKITMWQIQIASNILWIIFFIYIVLVVAGYIVYLKCVKGIHLRFNFKDFRYPPTDEYLNTK